MHGGLSTSGFECPDICWRARVLVLWVAAEPASEPTRQQETELCASLLGLAIGFAVIDRDELVEGAANEIRDACRMVQICRWLPSDLHALTVLTSVHD
ncbi:hypothetical protein HL653_23935 (plasmid) [Sphingomonas sp. AP4-R1]|uniref:hypothetical protein n=1 Tax=Sphingomonas sp. AP4-R1 TaxID=2735134 RepID=UPI0014936D18|nr:hypothetical protein [Sphingomonas sp. AP4-R1]QJU60964.1 hypothetical protein HL653_23935 [Sphingomonas sp. AP4-R1]